jgi:acyl-CoA synthetase (AMP-forming)/AMP-acid ligase II
LAAFSTFIQQHAASLCIAMEIKEMPAPSQLDVFKHSLQNTLSSQYGLDLKALLIFPPNVLPRTKTGKIKRNQCHVLIKEEHLL